MKVKGYVDCSNQVINTSIVIQLNVTKNKYNSDNISFHVGLHTGKTGCGKSLTLIISFAILNFVLRMTTLN